MKKERWNLLTTESSRDVNTADQFAAYAIAYLDAAQLLCSHLALNERSATYEKGSTILYLAQHAIELFLKGAIARRELQESFDHKIEILHNRYNNLYPEKRFRFDLSFTTNYAGFTKEETDQERKKIPKIDQLFRYPFDKRGQQWPGSYGFEANSFCAELVEIKSSFTRLLKEYEK
ncbi:hypothetical protein OAD57_08395 [Porticoccaceae bacterium]|nr:hypothetical protein [Porticoccaceae bacterium]